MHSFLTDDIYVVAALAGPPEPPFPPEPPPRPPEHRSHPNRRLGHPNRRLQSLSQIRHGRHHHRQYACRA